MKYVLIGYYGYGNCGDSASLFKVKKLILSLDSNASFKVFHPFKSVDSSLVHRWSIVEVLKAFFWSDKIVFGGGSIFQNVTSAMSLYYYLFFILLGKLFKKKIILLSQGIGPVLGTFNQFLITFCLRFIDKISVRDDYSFSMFKLNTDKHILLSSDITLFNEKKVFQALVQDTSVGFAFKSSDIEHDILDNFNQYINSKFDLVNYYAFFPEQDIEVYNSIGIAASTVVQVSNLFNQDNIPLVKVMIVMRYHAAIWCALKGIPFVVLSSDPKLDSIAKRLEQEYVSIEDESFGHDMIIDKFNKVFDNFDGYQTKLLNNTDELIQLAEKHKELFYETI